MTDSTVVDLLRHGACEGGEIYRGTTDVPLSPDGEAQMHAAISVFGDPTWTRVVTSPMARCEAFGRPLARRLGVELSVEREFREMDFGEWEGRDVESVWQEDRPRASAFYSNPGEVSPPGGESARAVSERAGRAWQALLERYRGEHLLLISHGGVIRLLLTQLLEMPLSAFARIHVPYASVARVRVFHDDGPDMPVLVALHNGSMGQA